jgi:hypothetical protein
LEVAILVAMLGYRPNVLAGFSAVNALGAIDADQKSA